MRFAVVAKGETEDASLGMLGDPGDGKCFARNRAGAGGEDSYRRAGIVFLEMV